ncbi:MAG: AAA family ATPase [Saprospiraceae bacterium]|nr:AAA family ATPase [Saprospiraceae bacterium]
MDIDRDLFLPEGYDIKEPIYKNDRHQIMKAFSSEIGKDVTLKITRPILKDIKQISKLSHEFNILREADHPGIIKVIELLSSDSSICLVEEYIVSESLKSRLSKGKLSFHDFFSVSIALCDALSYIHLNSIIHKDINTNNILITDENKIKLIDFGIAVNYQNETHELSSIDMIEGILVYISPEQTGRTSYSVSNCSDLYSFGIVMYEMLSGKPPFISSDPLEVIHYHLSRTPTPLSSIDNEIPLNISNMVNALLAKNPDDRYQSASGLLNDLILLKDIYIAGKSGDNFILKQKDFYGKFKKTQRLYGRDEETDRLLSCLDALPTRKSMLALVSGYSGIGKSVVVKQLQKPVIERNGKFLSGKFDQYKRNTPYFAFIEVFDEAIRNILASSEENIKFWREKISLLLGSNSSLITEVIPNLELIIGKYPPTFKLQPAEQEFRFRMAFLDFVFCFAEPDRPLVIFLDDLQWSDVPSLNLIEMILSVQGNAQILIIGAYRNNEINELHPLTFTIDKIKKEGINLEELRFQPLDNSTTIQIVADSFGIPLKAAKELGNHVYFKTKGNPFFINRFLLSLYENKYIVADQDGNWIWDQKNLDSLGYTDNVIDLMTRELALLPAETQEMIKSAAVLGSLFNLGTLSTIVKSTQREVFQKIIPAIKGGYLLTADNNYRTLSLPQRDIDDAWMEETDKINYNFRFLHDRVQQAAYALIPKDQLADVHLNAGRILFDSTSEDKLTETIFDIVSHFSEYTDLITDPEERKLISRLFLIAGKKAKDSTSYDVAVKYLSNAYALLNSNSWESNYKHTFSVYSELGECEYLNGNNDKAEYLFEQILKYARTNFEKLRTYYTHSSLCHKVGNASKAMELGKSAMKLYNIKFPEKPIAIKLTAGWEIMKNLFLFSTVYRDIDRLNNLKECKDPEIIAINQYLIDIATSAYHLNQELMVIVVLRIIKFYLKHGFTDASGWGLSGFSVIVYSALGLSNRGLKLWDLTIRLHQKTHTPLIKSKLGYTVNAFHSHWKKHINENFDDNLQNIQECLANGDQSFIAYGICDYLWNKSACGIPLREVEEVTKEHIDYLKRSKNEIGYYFTAPKVQVNKCLVGNTPKSGDWNDDGFYEPDFKKMVRETGNLTALARFYSAKLSLFYYFGNYKEGLVWAEEGENFTENLLGFHTVTDWYFHYGLIIISSFDTLRKGEKSKYKKIYGKILKWFRHWNKGCTVNFEQQYNMLLAGKKYIEGEFTEALKLYELAIQLSSKNGFIQYEAIANYQASVLVGSQGLERQSIHYLKDAWTLYQKWDAFGICDYLKSSYPHVAFEKRISIQELNQGDSSSIHSNSTATALDFSTIVKASQSLAGIIRLEDLLERLIYIIIENAGAQKGVLILEKNNELYITAEGYSGPDKAKVLDNVPVANSDIVPESLVNYCWRTQEKVSLSNAYKDDKYGDNPYIQKNKVISIICFPFSNKGKRMGLLYLENNLIEGVFNSGRVEILNLLSGQIGISIENALLYENLEEKVDERTKQLATQKEFAEAQRYEAVQQRKLADEERKKSDDLLLNILPLEIAEELKSKGSSDARLFENVTVLFTDFVNFTRVSEKLTPHELVKELNHCFEAFDHIMDRHGLEKIKTIGDAYLAVSGLPKKRDDHALLATMVAFDILKWVNDHQNNCPFDIRIGLNSGPVVAGIVGFKKYVYDIWGDTVNTAARMETASEAGKINVSEVTYQLIKNSFSCTSRGKIEAKNKGSINMYFVDCPFI